MRVKIAARIKIASVTFILLAVPCFCRAQQRTQASSSSQQAAQQAQAPAQALLRVSGDVMAAKLVHAIPPVYPPIAEMAHVTGTVVLHAIIAADGGVRQLTLISGPPLLRQAAINAVRQWRFEPTLLNGQPVEVDTVLPVHFACCGPELVNKAETRDAGSPRMMLTESLEAMGAGEKQNWVGFLHAFEDATSRAWLSAIPSSAADKKGKVSVEFDMRRDGSIDGALLVTRSSHDPAIDDAANLAMRKCAPFHGVPADFPYVTVHFRVTFGYDRPHPLTPATGGAQ